MKKHYRYKHIVSFDETNLVGNVYFANHVKWQGRCREMFLKEHAPDVLLYLESGEIILITLNCNCEYFGELRAFDEVIIEMELGELKPNRLEMIFRYFRDEKMVAKGRQEVACMRLDGNGSYEAIPFPEQMLAALHVYETQ